MTNKSRVAFVNRAARAVRRSVLHYPRCPRYTILKSGSRELSFSQDGADRSKDVSLGSVLYIIKGFLPSWTQMGRRVHSYACRLPPKNTQACAPLCTVQISRVPTRRQVVIDVFIGQDRPRINYKG